LFYNDSIIDLRSGLLPQVRLGDDNDDDAGYYAIPDAPNEPHSLQSKYIETTIMEERFSFSSGLVLPLFAYYKNLTKNMYITTTT
jgi:hypothetical protein